MKKFLTALFLICFFSSIHAQEDSLLIQELDTKEGIMIKLYRKGKFQEIVVFARENLVWAEDKVSKEHVVYGRAMANLGTALNWAGENEEAIEYLEAAKDILEQILDPTEEAYIDVLNNLGMLYKDVGKYEKALPLLKSNISRAQTAYGEHHYYVSAQLNNLALLYNVMGQSDDAISTMKESIRITELSVGKKHRRYAVRVGALASFYKGMNNYQEAATILEDVLPTIIEHFGKEHPAFTSAANNLATVYVQQNRLEEAQNLMEEVLEQAEKVYGKEHRTYGIYLTSYALLCGRKGENRQALKLLDDALQIDLKNGGQYSRGYSATLQKRPIYLERIGEVEAALADYQEINQVMAWRMAKQFPYFSEKSQNALLDHLKIGMEGLHSFAYRHPQLAEMKKLGYEQSLLFKGALRNNYQNLMKTIEQSESSETKALAIEWDALKTQLSQQYNLPIKKRMPQLDSLEQVADDLENQLAQSTQQFRQNQQTVHWQDIQATLKADEVAIEFSHFEYEKLEGLSDSVFYAAYVLTKDATEPQMIRLFEEKEIGNLKATRSLYSPEIIRDKPNLKNLIWQPLSNILKDKKTIYFSPSGILHRINLGAIPMNEQETIADHFQLQQMGSTRQLIFQKENKLNLKNAVVYGGIRYDTDSLSMPQVNPTENAKNLLISRALQEKHRSYRGDDWDYLSFTKTEAEGILELLKNKNIPVQLHSEYTATEESFKALGSAQNAPSLIHLATHGYFFSTPKKDAQIGVKATENPLVRSGLILAGANRIWEGGEVAEGQEDGILTAYEIAQMDLSNTELVVLSACETGLGDIEGSEGVYGLQRAFKIAGANYILMSLWKVRDEQTQEFMTAFYEAWLNGGMEIPMAFQTAQQTLREKYAAPFNPSLWAGFVLIQ